MGLRPVGAKLRRRMSEATGTNVIQAAGRGGWVFAFTTDDHRHGYWDKRTGEVEWGGPHRASCNELFPQSADCAAVDGGVRCELPEGHVGWHNANKGRLAW